MVSDDMINDENEFRQDWQLLAYLEGDVDEATAKQIQERAAQDSRFSQYLQELADMQAALTALQDIAAPSSQLLGEYELGLLGDEERADVERYLAQFPHRRAELAEMHEYLEALASQETKAPSEAAPTPAPTLGEQVRTIVAQLLRSTGGMGGLTPALAGQRGKPKQLAYQAAEFQVFVDVQDDPEELDRQRIIGLIIGCENVQALTAHLFSTVQISQDTPEVASVPVDDTGNFVFSALPPSVYLVVIRGPDFEIHVPNVST